MLIRHMFFNVLTGCLLFFYKQKTAYEMRISDWSSDVCSSDLDLALHPLQFTQYGLERLRAAGIARLFLRNLAVLERRLDALGGRRADLLHLLGPGLLRKAAGHFLERRVPAPAGRLLDSFALLPASVRTACRPAIGRAS